MISPWEMDVYTDSCIRVAPRDLYLTAPIETGFHICLNDNKYIVAAGCHAWNSLVQKNGKTIWVSDEISCE